MKKHLLFIFLVGLFISATATHIVGGVITYKYISGNTYEIKLTVYRDCNSTTVLDGLGAPGSPLARLWVYSNGNFVDTISMGEPVTQYIGPPIDNPCLTNTSGVCVEEGVYTARYTFPSANASYLVEYARCCRNGSISNLLNPGDQGATYSVVVPPTASYRNTSPVFKRFPPIFICLNAPLRFDHAATDADGDQLVYSLCPPFIGGSTFDPAPYFPGATQTNVTWAPGYSAANPLGNNSLAIGPSTGLLTGNPNAIGQFVVGVCISEYRNGALIGTYLRDFQFNVTTCNIPFADIPSTDINANTGIGLYVLKCDNYSVTFDNKSYNPPPTSIPLQYFWDFGVPGASNDTSHDQYPTFTYPDTGTYLLKLVASKSNNGLPCGDTSYAYVKVFPTFTSDFVASDVCQDSTVQFNDRSSSAIGTITKWRWNFGDGDTSLLVNPAHLYRSPGTYPVMLINENTIGCFDTVQKNITIHPLPSTTFAYGPPCEKVPVSFALNSLAGISSYTWNFGGVTSTQTNPTNTYPSAGSYTVDLYLQSPQGCKDTVSQPVTIRATPVINIAADTTICANTSAQLYASGGISYTWSPAATLDNAAIATPKATPVPFNSVTYTVSVTDQYQCSATGSAKVSFLPLSIIDAGVDTSVCLNPGSFRDSVRLKATGGSNYQWTPTVGLDNPLVADPLSRPPGNTMYYVNAIDVYGCQYTDSVRVYYLDPTLNLILEESIGFCERDTGYGTVVDQGASLYMWAPRQYLTNPGGYNTGFFPPDTTFYVLRVENYCYTKSDSILVAVNPLPNLALNPLDSICDGDSIQLQANNALVYTWNNNPTLSATDIANPVAKPLTATKYYVTGTSELGCRNRDSTQILVYSPSPITVAPKDLPYICQGKSVRLSVDGGYTYNWSPASSLDSATDSRPLATPQDTTRYVVTATNEHGCISKDSLTINVQLPVTAVAESADACKGVPLQLEASGGKYYQWMPALGLSNQWVNNPYFLADVTQTYSVKVSNDCFSDFATVTVTVHELPFVDAGDDTLMWRDTYIELAGTTNEVKYFWQPSTWLDDPYLLTTKAQPGQTTKYELFAIDEFGCLNKDSVTITVEGNTILSIPTAFSPNGDGMNDIFRVAKWLNIERIKDFSVYNRWGNQVFVTTDITSGWDGTMGGKEQPLGVYAWVLIAQTKDGEEIVRKGNITLIR